LLYNGVMNVPNKFVENLSDSDYQKLIENYQKAGNFRLRNRSHAIILSFQKYSIADIAAICQVHRDTVSRWIQWWNENGFASLADLPKTGRPSILSLEEQAKAVEIGLQNPKFPHRELARIKQETGKQISSYTLKRLLKKKILFGSESS
jgi:transposase